MMSGHELDPRDGEGGGGHGPGRNTPDKSSFPSHWSDEKTIEAIMAVANDPQSTRSLRDNGRTAVEGTRDGIDIKVIIGADRRSILTAYPTNVTDERNERSEVMMSDYDATYQGLMRLHEATLPLKGYFSDDTREFIEEGEYGLALDGIAAPYLRNNAPMHPDLFAFFEALAADFELERDPAWAAVAKLRQRGPNPPLGDGGGR